MKRKGVYTAYKVIVLVAVAAVVAFYLYDVIALGESVTENLFRTVALVSLLLGMLIRLSSGGGRKSLEIYEKAYEDEIGYAFHDRPFVRKKLLCACRLYDEGNYRKALKYLYDLLRGAKQERDVVPVLLFIALCYSDAGAPSEAIKVYYEVLRYAPNDAKVHSNLGLLHMEEGNFDMALQHYNKSIECKPDHYYAYINRANYYFRLMDDDRAVSDALYALDVKNNGVEAASLLAILFALRGDEDNRQKYFRIAVTSGKSPEDLNEVIHYYRQERQAAENSEDDGT